MKKKRVPISRRDFFRIAGLATTSLAAGKIEPSSRRPLDLKPGQVKDAAGRPKRPWWVRTVDEPTVEISWERIQRFDARNAAVGQGFSKYVGQTEFDRLNKISEDNETRRLLDNTPGYTLKDHALNAAQMTSAFGKRSFLGPQVAPTPEERGVPSWKGSSDQAACILRTAMRHFGAATVGFVELNERTRKLIFSHDPDGKEIVFEDVDEAYETEEKRVIPHGAKWVIVYTVQMSTETIKRAPTIIAAQTTMLSYDRGLNIQNKTQEFLRGLGYQCLGEARINALGVAPALGVMAGLGELSRQNRLITPEFGPMVRVFKLITDLPLTIDKPIDAGILEFCSQCKKCAEACPAGALSLSSEPYWEIVGDWNNPGHKAYFEDSVKCHTYWREIAGSDCSICFAVCPFSKKDKAWIHSWVKAGVSTLPLLDGFFRSMDDAFSYGAQKDPEAWWYLDLPEYGIDTEQSVQED
jgi:reductive dehalogenase